MTDRKYYWEYLKLRKNERYIIHRKDDCGSYITNKKDLPKTRISKWFKSKKEALEYWKPKKKQWLQASLYFKQGLFETPTIAEAGKVNTHREYIDAEKLLKERSL